VGCKCHSLHRRLFSAELDAAYSAHAPLFGAIDSKYTMLRDAIDAYHEAAAPSIPGVVPKIQTKFGSDGWPLTLEALVEGETIIGDVKGKKLRFLRRIPIDPITNSYEWGLRSSQDETDSKSWGGENVWDIYCKAHVLSLDGVTYYDEW